MSIELTTSDGPAIFTCMNVTLSMPREVRERAERMAQARDISLSTYVCEMIERDREVAFLEGLAKENPGLARIAQKPPIEERWDDPRWAVLARKHIKG